MITDPYGHVRPITAAERIARKMTTMPKINVTTGRPLPIADQPQRVQAAATVDGVPYATPAPPIPELGESIVRVAQELRVDPFRLLADEPFATGILGHDPTDLEGIARAIQASAVKPTMKHNPAQGASGRPQPIAPESQAEKVARMVANSSTSGGNFASVL